MEHTKDQDFYLLIVHINFVAVCTHKPMKQRSPPNRLCAFLQANKAAVSHPNQTTNKLLTQFFCLICLQIPLPYFSRKWMRVRNWKYCTRTKHTMARHLESCTSKTRPRAMCDDVCVGFPHVAGCIYELPASHLPAHLPLMRTLLLTHPQDTGLVCSDDSSMLLPTSPSSASCS